MNRSLFVRCLFAAVPLLAATAPRLNAQNPAIYFPPSGKWQKKSPAELGLDAAKLQQAID